MDDFLVATAKDAPYVVVFVFMIIYFLRYLKENEERRQSHENELERKREAFTREMNNMWANSIKLVTEQTSTMHESLLAALQHHEEASQRRYERMGITRDLMKRRDKDNE